MHRVWPLPAGELDPAQLEELYVYPERSSGWVAVNFVSSLDGGIEIDGKSRGLSSDADRKVFGLGHDLADVVLLASGTAVAEEYPGLRPEGESARRRERHGLAAVPPLAVVTSGSLPADAPSVVDVLVPTIVITCASAPADKQRAWQDAGAEVLIAGDDDVDLADAVRQLAGRGLRSIDCEGGPGLTGKLLDADLVDEMRISFVPTAVAGQAGRVARTDAPLDEPRGFTVDSLLVEDSTLLVRYLRTRG
ncbi:dihydrofolate reductase family protein [Actinomycetospora soli]|uniref:dihydrofolate reductase family protein n=1 Tax=Actinomycetospora soli TaxID=2893887 RepID=UPI001E3B8585|nr:dihydrofolate reductase family protein [Actinomycetospora soli]MCD2185774.1 dihydrofolate reductase family protein [Actinomycetospora soli]